MEIPSFRSIADLRRDITSEVGSCADTGLIPGPAEAGCICGSSISADAACCVIRSREREEAGQGKLPPKAR